MSVFLPSQIANSVNECRLVSIAIENTAAETQDSSLLILRLVR